MYFERLKKAYEESGLTKKLLAEKANVSEKTIKRILDNPNYRADLDTMTQVSKALNITMQELFSETDVVLIRKDVLAELEEASRFVEECRTLSTENISLKDELLSLTKKYEELQTTLRHKEEIIALHESYKVLLDDLARMITETSTDTQ